MSRPAQLLAIDLGAGSGRAVLGTFGEGRLSMREVARFPNGLLRRDGGLYWDVQSLFGRLLGAVALAVRQAEGGLASLGVDTWGVDFALLDGDGGLLDLPRAYRDPRCAGGMEWLFRSVPRERVHRLTGVQFLPFNTLFQLAAMARDHEPALAAARKLLLMPDLFHFLLSGVAATEFTIATTSQLWNPVDGRWEPELLCPLGLPDGLMQDVVPPGTRLGPLLGPLAARTGAGPVPVTAVATHDTASAVAAIPAEGEGWAFLSSGTWSLLGVEMPEPLITPEGLAANLTSEGGVAGRWRVLRNITGLWLLERCREHDPELRRLGWEEAVELAAAARPFGPLVDPDHPAFLDPPDMPAVIRRYCAASGQPPPVGPAELVRCVLESVAAKSRFVLDLLRQATGRPVDRLHMVGGGVRNRLLCRLTAGACGVPVIAGPEEATAAGNLLVQALATGLAGSQCELRRIATASFPVERYEPANRDEWERARERFAMLVPR